MAADGSITISITGDAKALETELKKVQAQIKQTEQQSQKSSGAAGRWGAIGKKAGSLVVGGAKAAARAFVGVTKAMAGATAAAAVFSVKAGVEYESAFAGVRKTTEATEEEYQKLSDGIISLSNNMPESASSIAGVAEAAGQLGIAKDDLLSFTETMVKLGDATNLTADEAATTLARIANVTGMDPSNYERLGSTIVALGNNFATTEAEITAMGSRIAGAGTQVGMSEADIMSFSTALSSVGIEAEAGGSSFSTLVSKMELATTQGGESLNQFAEVAGMSADEFKQAFEKDASGAILSFIQGLGNIDESGGSVIGTLDEMGLSDIRMSQMLTKAAGASDTFTKALKLGSKAWEENTALTNEANERYKTVESQWEILKNRVTNLGTAIYDSFKEPFAEALSQVNDVVLGMQDAFKQGGFSGMAEYGYQTISNLLAGIDAAMPQVAPKITQAVISGVNGLVTMAPSLISAGTSLIANLLSGIEAAGPTIGAGIGQLVVQGVTAIVSLIPNFTSAGLSMILGLLQGLNEGIPNLIAAVPEAIAGFANAIVEYAPQIIPQGMALIANLAIGIIKAIPSLIAAIPKVIGAVVTGIASGFGAIGGAIRDAFTGGTEAASGEATASAASLGQEASSALTTGIDGTAAGTQLSTDFASGIASGSAEATTSAAQIATSAATGLSAGDAVTATTAGTQVAADYSAGISSGAGSVSSAASTLASAASSSASTGDTASMQSAGSAAANAYASGLTSGASGATANGKQVAAAAAKGMLSAKSQYASTAKQLLTAFQSGIKQKSTSISQAARAVAQAGATAARGKQSLWTSAGSYLAQGMATGISNGSSVIENAAIKAVNAALKAAKDAAGVKSPSRVWRDDLGQWLPAGGAEGIKKGAPRMMSTAKKLMQDTVHTAGKEVHGRGTALRSTRLALLSDNGSTGRSVSTSYTTNHYGGDTTNSTGGTIYYNPTYNSPTPMNRAELARQTKRDARRLGKLVRA